MSINKLLAGDCGGNNSLVQLSNIVARDVQINQPRSQADKLVDEFVAQTSNTLDTFNMNALLNNIHEAEKTSNSKKAFLNNPFSNVNNQRQDAIWQAQPSTSYMSYRQSSIQPFLNPQPYKRQVVPTNVQIEYVDESDLSKMEDTDVKAKGQESVNGFKDDDELAYNQFMSFMRKISAGELNLGENTESAQKKNNDEILKEMSEKYKEQWDKLSDVSDYWSNEAAFGISKEYTFAEGNIMLENKTALEIGKEKLKMGDIPGAVICFEAAVQQLPTSAEAWFLLGTTQTENEQDHLAIPALKKSLEIDPTQLEAYITLAAAYTNENMSKYAFVTLVDWLRASPKYSDLLPQDIDPKKLEIKELEGYVKSLYLKAAQLNPTQIDPDVQNALGVVFNISQEYDKAVDCFKTALMIASNSSKLWNRLGATLANSDRSEEAVDAYHQALNLEPGFIRARYNVGITCMNLGAYRQAAEHFLVALNQQCKAQSLHSNSSSTVLGSSTIWTTLRMVCSFMGEHEIAKLVDERNLGKLNSFFDIE